MSITTLQKNYKKLENRLGMIERLIREFFGGELKDEELKKLESISKKMDKGQGRRIASRGEFQQYLESL